jgi:hypothetical protein
MFVGSFIISDAHNKTDIIEKYARPLTISPDRIRESIGYSISVGEK